MSMSEIKNAKIRSTMLGREDHGILTFMIFIDFDECVTCGVGGYSLDHHDRETDKRIIYPYSMELISEILDVVGVDRWEDLPGKYIRFHDNGWGKTITKIGNIIEDKWISFPEFFESRKGE